MSRRPLVQLSSALAEIALLEAILKTLTIDDPLHSRISDLFSDESDCTDVEAWNQHYDRVLAQARRRIV